MTVTLNLTPDLQERLQVRARTCGMSIEEYVVEQILRDVAEAASTKDRKSLPQLFAESPLKGLELDFERDADTGRPVAL